MFVNSFKLTLADSSYRWLLPCCLFLLAFGYLLQIFSPLRLNGDSATLLAMAVSADQGHGYLVNGHPTQFPFGYPFVIKTFLQAHVANSRSLIILNLVCLWVGLVAVLSCSKTVKVTGGLLLPVILVLSSWVMVKHVTIPLSEFLYFSVSLLSLHLTMLFWATGGDKKWWFLGMAILCGLVAVQCRTIGLSLFPMFIITAWLHRDLSSVRTWLGERRNWLGLLVGVGLVGGWCIWYWVHKTPWYELQFMHAKSYGHILQATYQDKTLTKVILNSLLWFMVEFGTLFSNVPLHMFPQMWSFYMGCGFLAWGMVLYGAWLLLRARQLLPLVAYFASFSLVIFLWASHEERLWLPILPILAILFLVAADDLISRWPSLRYSFRCYLIGYIALGAVALVYSTKLSLSGRDFGELYGNGATRMTYRYAFANSRDIAMNQVDQEYVQLLRIFEPLAKTNPTGQRVSSP